MDPEYVNKVRKRLGARLLQLRHHRKATQNEIAARAELSEKWVGELERGEGNPALDSLIRLADALEVEVGALFESGTKVQLPPALSPERLAAARNSLEFLSELLAYLEGQSGDGSGSPPDDEDPGKNK